MPPTYYTTTGPVCCIKNQSAFTGVVQVAAIKYSLFSGERSDISEKRRTLGTVFLSIQDKHKT